MSELTDHRGHYIAAGNAVIALGLFGLLLLLVGKCFGLDALTPPGLGATGTLFVVVGAVLRRGG